MPKPFFSIRIEWNPADSEDESHRDCFSVRRTVARQHAPCPEWKVDEKERSKPYREDTSRVVQAITECIHDLNREAMWMLPDLIEDVVFEVANKANLEDTLAALVAIAVDGADDKFLEELQKIIDKERAGTEPTEEDNQ